MARRARSSLRSFIVVTLPHGFVISTGPERRGSSRNSNPNRDRLDAEYLARLRVRHPEPRDEHERLALSVRGARQADARVRLDPQLRRSDRDGPSRACPAETDGSSSKPAAIEIECCPVEISNRGARGHHPVPMLEHSNHCLLRHVFRLSSASRDEVERPRQAVVFVLEESFEGASHTARPCFGCHLSHRSG
jgi:hypothetical protein